MKNLFLIAISLTSILVFGQNWSPILTNKKMNYQHSDSAYISHSLWVDSFEISGSDTTLFFNKVVTDHPTDLNKALRNQSQFLYSTMLNLGNGAYHFSDPGYYILKSWATVGDSWLFDPDNNLLATVSGVLQEEIFGVMDSVKVISLADGNEIKLSKSFGILQFPDFENDGFYELVGIQDSEFGESIPGFWNIYDIEVGDVFQYDEYSWFMATNIMATRKITIIDKSIVGNTITYFVDGIYSAFGIDWMGGQSGGWEAYPYTEEIEITDSIGHLANKFPNELAILPYSESMTGSGKVFARTMIYFNDSLNTTSKKFGLKFYPLFSGSLYYDMDEESDTIYKYNEGGIYEDPCGNKGEIFSNYLGKTLITEGCFEYETTTQLEGYIKNGDTIGIITSDSTLLTVSIEDNLKRTESIKVYPNPASDVLNICLPDNKNAMLEIRNIQGGIVFQRELSNKEETINVTELIQGVYFYSIFQYGKIIQRGKVLIN